MRCRRRSRFFLRLQCSALFKPISLFHSARRARARDGGDQRHHFKEARHGAMHGLSLSLCRSVESSLIDCMKPSFPGVSEMAQCILHWEGGEGRGERGGCQSLEGRHRWLRCLFCTCTLYPSLLCCPSHPIAKVPPPSRVPLPEPGVQGWFPCAACDKPTAPHDDDGGGGVGGAAKPLLGT